MARSNPANRLSGTGATRNRSSLLLSTALVAPAALVTAILAFLPVTAHAATDNWTGTLSNNWGTAANWASGVPITTSSVFIQNTANNPVQLNANASLNGSTGALTIGTGPAPGTPLSVLNIGSGDTLTMGARPVTLNGGSITGPGTLSSTGAISGYGTISSQISGTSFTANSTNGAAFGGFSPFVNGTPGTPLTLIGQNNLASDSFAISAHGNFNFQGVTITAPSLSGVSTNLNAGPSGGNNYYGLLSFTGAASTLIGNVGNSNYEQLAITGTTLHLNGVTMSNNWGTSAPASWVVNAGGVLDNSVGNTQLQNTVTMNGGTLSNSGGGILQSNGIIRGTGTVSGVIAEGGITASGGLLTVDGTTGTGVTAASAGWTSSVGSTLDLKGNINFQPYGAFPAAPTLNTSGGTVQLDSASINTPSNSGSIWTGGNGTVEAHTGVNTVNGNFIPSGSDNSTSNVQVDTGATLKLNNGVAGVAAVTANTLTLQHGAALSSVGANNVVSVRTDYVNADWGSGNSFNPNANVTGAAIDAAGTGPFQTITGSAVTNGATTTPTLALGAVHVGDSTSQSFAIKNTGTNDPSLRGAVQTTGLTDGQLSGVTAGNFGPIASGSSTGPYSVAFNASTAGALTNQSIAVVSNFANVPTQTIDVTGAAYHYADPVWSKTGGAGTFSGGGDAYMLDLGTLHNGVTTTADLQILNQLFADDLGGSYTDLLGGSFNTQVLHGTAFDLTGFGTLGGLAAGGTLDQTVSYDHVGAPYGFYEEIITFNPTSYDAALGYSNLGPITLTVEGTATPEAGTITMILFGFASLGAAAHRRQRNRLSSALA